MYVALFISAGEEGEWGGWWLRHIETPNTRTHTRTSSYGGNMEGGWRASARAMNSHR